MLTYYAACTCKTDKGQINRYLMFYAQSTARFDSFITSLKNISLHAVKPDEVDMNEDEVIWCDD